MIREKIERAAREVATQIDDAIQKNKWQSAYRAFTGGGPVEGIDVAAILNGFAIAILTDPAVGYKGALELAHRNRFLCQNCRRSIWDRKCDDHCTCPCHTASAKLKELKELK